MRLVYWGLCLLAIIFALAGTAGATHFRYGTLSWEPTENPGEVLFTGGQAWRASAFGSPSVGSVIPGESSIVTGDGGSEQVYLKVTSVSAVNDYFTAAFVDASGDPGIRHTYASPNDGGSPWMVSWSSCCRISPSSSGNFHANNPDQSERLETRVNLAAPPNSAPKSSLPPINPCPREALCTIAIPFVDAEADPVTFRLSTAAEAGDANYRPPGPSAAPNTASVSNAGILTWDTHGATVSPTPGEHTLYSIQVMLEDGRTQTPLDFFLEIVPADVHPPVWVTPPTPCGETFTTAAGVPLGFGVEAMSPDGRNVLLATLGLPAGASLPIPAPSNPVTSAFTWTPTLAQAGSHLLVLTAEDDRGYAAPPCAITIRVVKQPVAVAGPDVCAAFGTTITLDGTSSINPEGTILDYRWDFPHGASPVHGAVITRTLNHPADLAAPYVVRLTITTNDSRTFSDTLTITAYDSLSVTAAADKAQYTPFQRPSGFASARIPCGASSAGAAIDLTITYTTHDATLDAQLAELLGPDALSYRVTTTLDAAGRMTWRLPFTVAERFALPLGLLNPTSQLLVLQGDYVVAAAVTQGSLEGEGSSTFDVVLDPQFPLDEPPAAVVAVPREEESA